MGGIIAKLAGWAGTLTGKALRGIGRIPDAIGIGGKVAAEGVETAGEAVAGKVAAEAAEAASGHVAKTVETAAGGMHHHTHVAVNLTTPAATAGKVGFVRGAKIAAVGAGGGAATLVGAQYIAKTKFGGENEAGGAQGLLENLTKGDSNFGPGSIIVAGLLGLIGFLAAPNFLLVGIGMALLGAVSGQPLLKTLAGKNKSAPPPAQSDVSTPPDEDSAAKEAAAKAAADQVKKAGDGIKPASMSAAQSIPLIKSGSAGKSAGAINEGP